MVQVHRDHHFHSINVLLLNKKNSAEMMKAVVLACFLAVALAAPTGENILSYDAEDHKHTQSGDAGNSVTGSYSYTDADGKTYTVHYVADEKGYRATGDHLPVAPEVPAAPVVPAVPEVPVADVAPATVPASTVAAKAESPSVAVVPNYPVWGGAFPFYGHPGFNYHSPYGYSYGLNYPYYFY